MIIMFRLKNNKFTQIIERFLDDGGPFVLTYHNSKEEFRNFWRDVYSYDNYKCLCRYKEDNVKPRLEKTIKEIFIKYINSINEDSNWKTERFTPAEILKYKEDILDETEVKLVNLILDQSYDRKRVYYIGHTNKRITL